MILVGCADNSMWTFSPNGGRAPYHASQSAVSTNSVGAGSSVPVVPSAGLPSASPTGPTVSLLEWKVAVAGTLKSGAIDLAITNAGSIPHELLIFQSDLDPVAYPTDAAGNIVEEGAGVTLVSDGDNIDPGGSQLRSVDLMPGKYLFVCNIPGHFKAGMYTVVMLAP